MVTKNLLDAQLTVELPAREMLALFNWSKVSVNQANLSAQFGILNGAGQSNSSGVIVIQN